MKLSHHWWKSIGQMNAFLQTHALPPLSAATTAGWLAASAERNSGGRFSSWEHPWPPSLKGGQEQG